MAHGIFAALALGCASAIAVQLVAWNQAIRLASAALLIVLGIRTLLKRSRVGEAAAPVTVRGAYGGSLLLALSNPMTVLPYIAVATGTAAVGNAAVGFSPWSVPGVVLGALAWYATLSTGVALFRAGLPSRILRYLNLLSGSALVGFGAMVGVG